LGYFSRRVKNTPIRVDLSYSSFRCYLVESLWLGLLEMDGLVCSRLQIISLIIVRKKKTKVAGEVTGSCPMPTFGFSLPFSSLQ
jgi:hypothetical protein